MAGDFEFECNGTRFWTDARQELPGDAYRGRVNVTASGPGQRVDPPLVLEHPETYPSREQAIGQARELGIALAKSGVIATLLASGRKGIVRGNDLAGLIKAGDGA